jgi:hypothetical protein
MYLHVTDKEPSWQQHVGGGSGWGGWIARIECWHTELVPVEPVNAWLPYHVSTDWSIWEDLRLWESPVHLTTIELIRVEILWLCGRGHCWICFGGFTLTRHLIQGCQIPNANSGVFPVHATSLYILYNVSALKTCRSDYQVLPQPSFKATNTAMINKSDTDWVIWSGLPISHRVLIVIIRYTQTHINCLTYIHLICTASNALSSLSHW